MSSNDKNRSRKLLVPLATMAVAAAVVVGSGATWTSTTSSSVSVTSGNLKHTNSQNTKTFTVENLKPGDVSTGTLKVTNTGSLDAQLEMTQVAGATNGFYENPTTGVSDLHLQLERDGVNFYDGDFSEFSSRAWGSGTTAALAAANAGTTDETTIKFIVSLSPTANDASQSKSAAASFSFVTTQLDANTAVSSLWK